MLIMPVAILAIEDEDDRALIAGLYERYSGLMYAVAYSVLKNHHDAQDAVNDAVIRLIDKISVLRGKSGCILRAYIVSMMRHISIDAVRKKGRKGYAALFDDCEVSDQLEDGSADVDEAVIVRATHEDFMQALYEMPVRERNLLQWKYYDGWTDQEIAGVMGIAPQSVRTALCRARKCLHDALERRGFEHEE